jgi:MOSC domain-containing protein YiiM
VAANGRVVSIHVAPRAEAAPVPLKEVRAVQGKGLEGDRYYASEGTYSAKPGPDRQVTLIESEAVEALARDYGIEMEPGETRRNLVTRGVALNHLVGMEFLVGGVRLRGIRLAEPCGHMEEVSGKKARPGLVHRGGLRAEILEGGVIRVGDHIEPLKAAAPAGARPKTGAH